MTSAQIRSLLKGPDANRSAHHAVEFLNTVFPSLSKVHSGTALPDAICQAKATSESYVAELAASRTNLNDGVLQTRGRAGEQLHFAQELSLSRHAISDELVSLFQELKSSQKSQGFEPSLLEEIEVLHRNLRELQSVKGYVQVVHRALQLSESAIRTTEQFPVTPSLSEASVTDYVLLREIVSSIEKAREQTEMDAGQDVRIAHFLTDLKDKTWFRMKDALSNSLLSAAEGLHWPLPVDYASASLEVRRSFESAFANLLTLQEIGERLNPDQDSEMLSRDGLYPLRALVRPIAQRFKYHFEGTRQTNRLDKPEWYFAHILNVCHEHRTFLEKAIQPLLRTSKYSSVNAWREFNRMLLPIIHRKIRQSMPTLLPHPPLLAHTIYQALAFDEALREAGFSLTGTLENPKEEEHEWGGTSDVILGNKDWFQAWLEGERKFAEDQYNDILVSQDAWHLPDGVEEDSSSDGDVRPTNSARRVKVLVEQITDRYKALPQLSHKTQFLSTVQVRILELYHTRISESLDAFESVSSFIARAVPGALAGQPGHGRDNRSMAAGAEGSRRLVKAYVSAKWMADTLSTWDEDMFFLELSRQINEKAVSRKHVRSVAPLPDSDNSEDERTIFEELVTQYNNLAERAAEMLIKQVTGEVEVDLKDHLFKQPDGADESGDPLLSQTLLGPIARLSAHLSFLSKTLPGSIVLGLYKRIAAHVANHILQRQVLYRGRGRTSLREGRVILEEANLWVQASRMAMGPSGLRRVEGPWERLLEAGRLLSLDGDTAIALENAARIEDEKEYDSLTEAIGITEMQRDEVLAVLSARDDLSR